MISELKRIPSWSLYSKTILYYVMQARSTKTINIYFYISTKFQLI